MSKMLMSHAWCRIRGQHLSDCLRFLVSDVSRQRRFYAKHKDDGGCCRDQPQSKGRQLEKWPKPFEPCHPPWKVECPTGPPPPNNDPYRIKVPEVMVPPLPATSAKWLGILSYEYDNRSQQQGGYGGYNYPQHDPRQQQGWGTDQWGNPTPQQEEKKGVFGMLKGLFGLSKKDKPDQYNQYRVRAYKEMGSEERRSQQQLFRNPEIQRKGIQDLFHNSAVVHPDYWKEKPDKSDAESFAGTSNARLGYHGRAKYQCAFHEPWKPLDRLALLAEAEEAEKEQLAPNIVDSFENTK